MLTKTQYTNDITRSALYYYDDAFNLTRMDDWNFHATSTGQYFEYDDAGRMTRYRDYDDDPSGTRQKVDYTYHGAGRLLTRAAYGNHDTLYFYDNIGRVTKVTSPGSKDWLYAFNTIGQVTEATMPNGMKTVYGYDSSDRRMTKIEHNDVSPVTLLHRFRHRICIELGSTRGAGTITCNPLQAGGSGCSTSCGVW